MSKEKRFWLVILAGFVFSAAVKIHDSIPSFHFGIDAHVNDGYFSVGYDPKTIVETKAESTKEEFKIKEVDPCTHSYGR